MKKRASLCLGLLFVALLALLYISSVQRDARTSRLVLEAIQSDDLKALERLISLHSPNSIRVSYQEARFSLLDHHRPLSIAAMIGSAKSVEILLEAGAQVSSRDDAMDSALVLALRAGNAASASVLIDGDISARTYYGWGFLMFYAGISGNIECMELVSAKIVKESASHENLFLHANNSVLHREHVIVALAKHDVSSATMYIAQQRGVNVNESDPYSGKTPAMYLAEYGKCDSVKQLLELGAKLDQADDNGINLASYIAEFCSD